MKYQFLKRVLPIFVGIFCISICIPSVAHPQSLNDSSLQKELEKLEISFDGRIGVFSINTANNAHIQYRSNERFPIQSTFKVMVVAAILKESINRPGWLQRRIQYKKSDLVFWSPMTEKNVNTGMTLFELCGAALRYSDNTATNLLMKLLGGPHAITRFARSVGDMDFRIEHFEPHLNSDPKNSEDTSTPQMMAEDLQKLTLGKILPEKERNQLIKWMKDNTTGDARIRSGVPKGWIVADKTGTGDYGITNDIGVIWSPHHSPIVIAIYFIQNKKEAEQRDAVIAETTRLVVKKFLEENHL